MVSSFEMLDVTVYCPDGNPVSSSFLPAIRISRPDYYRGFQGTAVSSPEMLDAIDEASSRVGELLTPQTLYMYIHIHTYI